LSQGDPIPQEWVFPWSIRKIDLWKHSRIFYQI
jgi:hypothetical protein